MLGRKNYTQEEIDAGRNAIDRHLAAHRKLAKAAGGSPEAEYFNGLALTLDRYFVHRLSGADWEGRDGNPLNELRILVDSLISHGGVMRADKQIKLAPARSVVGIAVGERINLSESDFKRLSKAFFAELQERFGP